MKWSKAGLSNEKCTGLVIGCLQKLYSVASLFQLSKTVLITSKSWTNPAKQLQYNCLVLGQASSDTSYESNY